MAGRGAVCSHEQRAGPALPPSWRLVGWTQDARLRKRQGARVRPRASSDPPPRVIVARPKNRVPLGTAMNNVFQDQKLVPAGEADGT